MRTRLIVPALVLAAACGGPSAAKTPTPAVEVAWKDMNADQKTAFMKDVVMPRATELFQAYDPVAYKELTCKTCHGGGADDKSFEMPNPDIHALPASEEAYMAWLAKDAEAARITPFMAEKLEPMMAELLQMTPFDPKTKTGEFGCMNCHMIEGMPVE